MRPLRAPGGTSSTVDTVISTEAFRDEVEQFLQAIGVFPVGSLIELATGEIGVVVSHDRDQRLEPRVLLLSTADKTPLPQPVASDVFAEGGSRAGKAPGISRGLPSGAFGFKPRDYYLDGAAAPG